MAESRRNNGKSYQEMESEDFSHETTNATDLSLSPDESELRDHSSHYVLDKRKRISKQLLERKQLIHDMQVLKIELSQKNMTIDNLKADSMQKVEELEEKLNEAVHKKQILTARLESQLKIQQDDARRRQEQIQKELDTILKRQHQLEDTNERLQERAGNIRRSLEDVELTEHQYLELRSLHEDELSLKQYVSVKLYEIVRPWKIETEELRVRVKTLNEETTRHKSDSDKYQELLAEERRTHSGLQIQHQKVTLSLADTKTQVTTGNYKVENYDKVKRERDEFDVELTDLKKQMAYVEATHQGVCRERDELSAELASCRQSVTLLKQDKDFLAKQASESSNKLAYAEERIIQLNEQVDRAKSSREELYEKYVASRDQYKNEYESKLQLELEQIRTRTNTEIDRLKTSTREMYERENRSLREARDLALAEKDRAITAEKELAEKYDQVLHEFRALQIGTDTKLSDLQNSVKLKDFEKERTQMVYEETVRNHKDVQLENAKLSKKLEVLTKEYYALQASLEKRVSELETLVAEKNDKLSTYEKLELELDDVVMQSAEMESEAEAERVLFSYGYGANVPTTARRRLKQSVNLARRVLQLERNDQTLQKEIEAEKSRVAELTDQLKSANEVLDQSQQPYHYMVEAIRTRDAQVNSQKKHITTLEQDVRRLEKERVGLTKSKNELAADLERLLNQREEMSVMKQVVLNLSQRRYGGESGRTETGRSTTRSARTPRGKAPTTNPTTRKKVTHTMSSTRPRIPMDAPELDENVHKPTPTEFTIGEAPNWYKKLHTKTQTYRPTPRSQMKMAS